MKQLLYLFFAAALLLSCTACKAEVPEPTPEPIDDTELAQNAYGLIEDAEQLCITGMDTVSFAWYFGIYDAPSCTVETIVDRLSGQIGFSTDFILENGRYTPEELINGDEDFPAWEFCLMTAEHCLQAAGYYDIVDEDLSAAKDIIKSISEDYANAQELKNYYTKVAAYAAFFKDIGSISYKDLQELTTNYENEIKMVKEPLLFDLGK